MKEIRQHKQDSRIPCERVSAEELSQLTVTERAVQFLRPTIVTGLIDTWPPFDAWLEKQKVFFHNRDPELFKRDMAIANASKRVLEGLQRDFKVPDMFKRALQRVLSYNTGEGAGVSLVPNHGFAWLAVVSGRKAWHLAPPHLNVTDIHADCGSQNRKFDQVG